MISIRKLGIFKFFFFILQILIVVSCALFAGSPVDADHDSSNPLTYRVSPDRISQVKPKFDTKTVMKNTSQLYYNNYRLFIWTVCFAGH